MSSAMLAGSLPSEPPGRSIFLWRWEPLTQCILKHVEFLESPLKDFTTNTLGKITLVEPLATKPIATESPNPQSPWPISVYCQNTRRFWMSQKPPETPVRNTLSQPQPRSCESESLGMRYPQDKSGVCWNWRTTALDPYCSPIRVCMKYLEILLNADCFSRFGSEKSPKRCWCCWLIDSE